MPVPGSGELSLGKIGKELRSTGTGDDYDNGPDTSNATSLKDASVGDIDALNEGNDVDGFTDTPYAMSEFYGYDHNVVAATFDSVFSNFTMADVEGETVISSAQAITISGGSGNTTVSVAGGNFGVIQVSLASSTSAGAFSYSSTSDNISHSSGTKYARFKWVVNHPLDGTGTESRTVTITNGNGASTTRTITATVQGE
tara:strand:- start:43 stop:639 length:597 start_codon:yes stop_codon:yes gene_type:complete